MEEMIGSHLIIVSSTPTEEGAVKYIHSFNPAINSK